MDEVTILPLLGHDVCDLKVARCVRIIAVSITVLAIAPLDNHHIAGSIVNELELHVALTHEDGARVQVVVAEDQVQLDVVGIVGLAKLMCAELALRLALLTHLLSPHVLIDLVLELSVRSLLGSPKDGWVSEQVALVAGVEAEVFITNDRGETSEFRTHWVHLHAHSAVADSLVGRGRRCGCKGYQ